MDLEMIAMELVGNAGESRSLSFEALSLAREGNFDEAEEKLKDLEDRYYDQFSAMEVALSKINSNQSAISSLLA